MAASHATLPEPGPGAPPALRRLAAILHADMVGYSRLVQLDELGTLSRLRAVRDGLVAPLIGATGGRVVDTAGDSVLAAFDSVTAAVRCAAELQRAVAEWESGPPDRRIRFRVGVELSDVPAGDGTAAIQGHGVNVAARLQAACPPGRVCVSRAVRDQLHGRAEFRFEALGPLALKNIAGPVEAFLVCEGVAPPRWRASASAVLRAVRRRRWPVLGTAALLSGAALAWQTGTWHSGLFRQAAPPPATVLPTPPPPQPPLPPSPDRAAVAPAPRLSLVVLPFATIGDDPARTHHLADAVTEDLTTDLSAIGGALVIARGSAFTYRNRSVDLRQVGRELGVRYAVQGSVRRLGDGVRVNAQLVSTETGAEIWTDRFDQDIADLALGQTDIVRRIARALGARLVTVEGQRSLRERPSNPDAFDLILRARSLLVEDWTEQRARDARALYEQALRITPESVTAMVGLANLLIFEVVGLFERRPGNVERAAELLEAAERLAPTRRDVLGLRAYVLRARGRFAEAIVAYQQVIAANPNEVVAYRQIAICKVALGQPEEAVPMLQEAIRRDPRDPSIWLAYSSMGTALLRMRLPQDAIAWLRRAIDENPARAERSSLWPRHHLASALGHVGRIRDARRELAEVVRMQPELTVRSYETRTDDASPVVVQNRYVAEGLRAAGLRDHAPEDADAGLPSDGRLSPVGPGATPSSVPGAATIRTDDLVRLIAEERPLVLDLNSNGRKRQPSYAAWRFALKFQGSSSARRPAGCPRARRSRTAAM